MSSRFLQDLAAYLKLNDELQRQEELLLAEHRFLFDEMVRSDYAKVDDVPMVFEGVAY